MPNDFTASVYESPIWYHVKNAGSRLALMAGQAAFILSTAWPQNKQDWVLFWLLMAANLGGVAISVNSAGKVAAPKS